MPNPEGFGRDAGVFRPERWVDADKERLESMERVVELCFGPGRWLCLGQPVTLMVLNKVFIEVCLNFFSS
jgi:cytochrome P450